ncbi:MAG: MFS transporter [Candidatus Bathyarchaeia archaeon]
MKRVIADTSFNYFVSGALALIIPLLLLEREVNVAEIGVVLSVYPLIFLSARLLFAAIADRVGWGHVFAVINWPAAFFSTLIYFLASSTFGFFVGKIVEALRESSYWAANRTAIFSLSPNREEREATRINAVIWFSTAGGSAVAGVGIAYIGFSSTLLVLIFASAVMGVPALALWKQGAAFSRKTEKPSRTAVSLSPGGRNRTFWRVSIALLFYSLATYPLITLLLPVFMDQQLRYNYLSIGAAFMLYNVIAALVTLVSLKKPVNRARALLQSVIGLVASFLLASSGVYFLALFLALAVQRGLGIGFFESIVAKVTKNNPTVSVDIGWLHVPTRLAEFFSVLTAGFVAQYLGYVPVFAASGVAFVGFSILSLGIVKQDHLQETPKKTRTLNTLY